MAKILIIDDEKIIRERLEKLLVLEGYTINTAENGPDGLDIFHKEKPDIVITDLKMPGMDGLEILKKIKNESKITEIIIITGHGSLDVAIQSMKEGAFDYIAKPINFDELEIAIKRALDKKKTQKKLEEHEKALQKHAYDLGERIKELNCLYGISRIVETKDITLEIILQEVVNIIPQSLQYSEITRARIIIEGREYKSDNFSESTWKQSRDIIVNDNPAGVLEVFHLEKKPESDEGPFLEEERNLINAVTGQLGRIIDRKKTEKQLKRESAINEAMAALASTIIKEQSINDISSLVLDQAKALTNSKFCFTGYIDPDNEYLISPTLTRDIWDECQIKDKTYIFKKFTGLWGWVLENRRSLMTNTPSEDPRSSGTPPGHIPIRSFLSAPAMVGEALMGIVALANARHKYTEQDMEIARRLASLYAIAIERWRKEKELLLAKEAAENASKFKSVFLANMSHELRTPLNPILGFCQILEDQRDDLNEKQLEFISDIHTCGEHLLEIVNDILDLSNIESGKTQIDKKSFDLNMMLSRTPLTLKSMTDKTNIKLKLNIQPDLGFIDADETIIKQVVYNLLSNAIKFTGAGSGKAIGIDAYGVDDRAVITIWDKGKGIPEKNIDRIFEPFERIHTGRTGKTEGTGLGLSISKMLVELHNGTLDVESKEDTGSRFTITLPGRKIKYAEMKKNKEEKTKKTTIKHTNKILVVEDNKKNQKLIKIVLESSGFDVTCVENGEEAVELSSKNAFDVILMDIQLPGIDGIETMKIIKKTNKYTGAILALTAYAIRGDKKKFINEGFDDYISKPINNQLLLDILKKYR